MGELPDANAVEQAGNAKCGDIMKIYMKIENDVIQDVKFKTFGCGAAVATSSMATEMVKGKTIKEALELTNKAVMEALDGLPPAKVHCSVLAEEAINAAIADYYKRQGIEPDMEIRWCGLQRASAMLTAITMENKMRIMLGMSGGVDSSVAALLLKQSGADVVRETLRLTEDDDGTNAENAKKVADALNISHITADMRAEFQKNVTDYFVQEYKKTAEHRIPALCATKPLSLEKCWILQKKAGAAMLPPGTMHGWNELVRWGFMR